MSVLDSLYDHSFWCRRPIRWIKGWLHIRAHPVGTLVEDCRFHPCIITENHDGYLVVYSLAAQRGGYGCDLFHCGIVKLTAAEVVEMIEVYKLEGERGLAKLRGKWSDEDYSNFEKNWRGGVTG